MSSTPAMTKRVFNEEDSKFADRDDDFSEESEDENTKSAKAALKDFTFTPGKKLNNNGHTFMEGQGDANQDMDLSKLSSVERIKEYLEEELGEEALIKLYPIIKSFGDDILFADKIGELKDKLKHIISGQ